ncbi:MAG: hypothetical protein Q8O98_02185 [bacterium]|nr:hypothetical protein [bacterium]
MEFPVEELKTGLGLDSVLEDKAKLAEEAKGQLVEEIASLKEEVERLKGELEAKLAEEPVEETDQDRFADLVDGLSSLSAVGKANLAEEVPGWTYQEIAPEPAVEEPVAEVAVANTPPPGRFRIVSKT